MYGRVQSQRIRFTLRKTRRCSSCIKSQKRGYFIFTGPDWLTPLHNISCLSCHTSPTFNEIVKFLYVPKVAILSKVCFEITLIYIFNCYRGVFPWKSSSSSKNHDSDKVPSPTVSWRLFGSKSSGNLSAKTLSPDVQNSLTPVSSGANTPHHHKRQGSSASEKQFEDLVASSIALIQHDR